MLDKIHYCKSLMGKIMVQRTNGKQGKCLSQCWRLKVTASALAPPALKTPETRLVDGAQGKYIRNEQL